MAHGSRNLFFAQFLLAVAWSATAADPTPPRIEVVFERPDRFVDVGTRPLADRIRDQTLGELKEHLIKRASGRIPAGQRLSVTITDVDQAGGFEPLRGPSLGHVRLFKDGYPPRIALTFSLTSASNVVIAEGKRILTDSTYLVYPANRSDPLRYEKKLLDDWLAREFPFEEGSRRR